MDDSMARKDTQLDDSAALYYHREPKPGKLAVVATKPLSSQVDLSLAYSPGVAAACRVIEDDPVELAPTVVVLVRREIERRGERLAGGFSNYNFRNNTLELNGIGGPGGLRFVVATHRLGPGAGSLRCARRPGGKLLQAQRRDEGLRRRHPRFRRLPRRVRRGPDRGAGGLRAVAVPLVW